MHHHYRRVCMHHHYRRVCMMLYKRKMRIPRQWKTARMKCTYKYTHPRIMEWMHSTLSMTWTCFRPFHYAFFLETRVSYRLSNHN